jgi:NAD(P)-dependent dehydrogenase (short-subunit alcohol dehydrogenase family)
MGATVLLLCRDAARGEAALQQVRAAASVEPQLYLADVADGEAVRRACTAMLQEHPRIDALLNNAGFMGYPQRRLGPLGVEATLDTNHLGYARMCLGLLPGLKAAAAASGEARIANVSSATHRMAGARKNWSDWAFDSGYAPMKAYSRSKLMNVVFTRELARRLEGSGVTANALHPGMVYTGVARTWPRWFRIVFELGRPLMASPEKGARTSVYVVASPDLAGKSGGFFGRCRAEKSAHWPEEETAQRMLWADTARWMGVDENWTDWSETA